jgi:poly-gamma-glutamate capsule biosynthesis protein CapA/YwtB (metallophosphatase superfamily)
MIKRCFLIVALALVSLATLVYGQTTDDFQIALTGDANLHQRLSIYDDPAYVRLYQHIRKADAAFTNLETLIHPWDQYGQAVSGGAWQSSPPWQAEELKWAGFNLISVANNHVFDFGVDGLRSTLQVLDAIGLVHAGAGENLAFARAPAYLDTRHGRVALIGSASTFTPGSLAGEQRPDLRGRPGLSPLRFSTTYTVDKDTFSSLRKVAELASGRNLYGGAPNDPTENGAPSTLTFGGSQYKVRSVSGVHTEPNKDDLAGILASVRAAHNYADWVVVTIHAHESQKGDREIPAEFVVAFAHAAIDAGADVFFVHGPHIVRGIEIYKGRPIFYSLGNYAFDPALIPFQPAEGYTRQHLPSGATIADYAEATAESDPHSYGGDKQNWETAVAEVTFTGDHKLKEIILEPLSLGYGKPRSRRGLPWPADPALAQSIVNDIRRLSNAYGTKVEFIDGRGIVNFDHASAVSK